jgi:polynucleotide 5'-hydroxyl-kinase GRC3/NOL9
MEFSTIQVQTQWQRLDISTMTGVIMVIGAADSGKSSFSAWLVSELSRHQQRVAWIDTDVGQSTLGIPGTMNLAVVDEPPAALPQLAATFFVGATSPRGHMLPILVGSHALKRRSRQLGAAGIVVDSSGLVAPHHGGVALKQWKIALLRPQVIVAIAHRDELRPILGPLFREPRITVQVLRPAAQVRRRSPEERRERRAFQLRHYFAAARPLTINVSRLPVYAAENVSGQRLLALQDRFGFTAALGVLTARDGPTWQLLTPLGDVRQVASLRVGVVTINPATGEQLD